MKVLYKDKSYNVESFDLDKGLFLLKNGEKIKENDIVSFNISNDDFLFIKDYKKSTIKTKKKIEEVEAEL